MPCAKDAPSLVFARLGPLDLLQPRELLLKPVGRRTLARGLGAFPLSLHGAKAKINDLLASVIHGPDECIPNYCLHFSALAN